MTSMMSAAFHWWHDCRTSLQIDIYATLVLFSGILKTQFLTDLLHSGLDLLNVVHRMIPLSDNTVKL